MAKIITSKSGKRYLVLDAQELTGEEERLVEASAAADKLAAAAAKAMRDAVLARQELQGHGFTQVYRSYGGGVKLLKGEVHEAKPKAESKSLADMLSEYDADGIAH